MTRVEAILRQFDALSESERTELIDCILGRKQFEGSDDDSAVGRRGLESLTDSAAAEDWSAYYPADLRNGNGASP